MTIYQHLETRPSLGKNVYVAPNAAVIGDVHLGDDASVWFSCVLRGDCFPIRVGARTNIQDGSVVHVTQGFAATTIGDDVTIGHMALIHGCTIGHRCLIGMGSILLDNCSIGDECIVAAGSLITPGTVIPPRSFVMGRPGKVVRAVTDDDLAWASQPAKLYQGYAETFRSSVKEISQELALRKA
jgi:carbonic anhydrase/acetyltransferase-like protein (isoleucine patch superfamily)